MPKLTKQWPFMGISRSRACSTTTATSSVPPPPQSFPLKHVTRSNFESALADLRGLVRAADFVAIDLEMTGITSAPWRQSLELDRFDVRYLKVKDSAEKFAVVQFGVCPFRWDSQSLSFVAHPHNFFVFPRQELLVDGQSSEFLCQTTSMDFLAKYQFDFNACINGGISYLSRVQEDEALRRLSLLYEDCQLGSRHSLKEDRDTPLASMTDVFFAERMKIRLSEWRDKLLRDRDCGSPIEGTLNDSHQPFQTIFFKMRPALTLNGFTSHQLRLIQSISKKHFKDLAYICMNGEDSRSQHFIVYTDSEYDKNLLVKEVMDEHRRGEEMKIKNTIGFRHVIDLLSSEQKLIVGHNCFLDIAHIYCKFFGPLPSTAEKFITSVNKYFPKIIDTKVLLNTNDVLQLRMKRSSTSLSSAFSFLCPQTALGSQRSELFSQRVKVEVEVDDTRSSIWGSGAKHEAGYDAFMTGCIFAQACSHLGIDFKVVSPTEELANSEKLQNHMNRLYLSWTNGDIIELSTGHRTAGLLASGSFNKRYPKILFENIVLIWGFPSKLKAREIKECICKVFGPTSVTSLYHLDETAVFVYFHVAELVPEFLALMESLDRNDDAISVLHPFSKLLEGGNTGTADYETYKEICSSAISKVFFAGQAEAVGIKWKTKLVESKFEVRTQEHEGSHKQSTVNNDSDSVEKNQRKRDYAIRLSDHEINDSFYGTEINQIGASNL